MMNRLLKRFTVPGTTATSATKDATASKRAGAASIARRKRSFTVAPSPLNPVKFELALIVIIGGLLWLLQDLITDSTFAQLLLLLGYGIGASIWLTWRVRRIVTETTQTANAGQPPARAAKCRDEK